jgi:hypothetical protein
LTQGELGETIEIILQSFRERHPLTLLEIDTGVRAKIGKVLIPDTLYHVLRRDTRGSPRHPINEKRMQVNDDAIRD